MWSVRPTCGLSAKRGARSYPGHDPWDCHGRLQNGRSGWLTGGLSGAASPMAVPWIVVSGYEMGSWPWSSQRSFGPDNCSRAGLRAAPEERSTNPPWCQGPFWEFLFSGLLRSFQGLYAIYMRCDRKSSDLGSRHLFSRPGQQSSGRVCVSFCDNPIPSPRLHCM